jgi:hypothetical protein
VFLPTAHNKEQTPFPPHQGYFTVERFGVSGTPPTKPFVDLRFRIGNLRWNGRTGGLAEGVFGG